MSQKFKIESVRVQGSPYLGIREDEDHWSSDSTEVMNWLSDGWRFRFNQWRADRIKDDAGDPGTDKEARVQYSHLSALPAGVIQSAWTLENKEWFAALRRIKTNGSNGNTRGKTPQFKSLKRQGRSFACWFNGGSNAKFAKLTKNRGEVIISGKNPSGKYGPESKLAWKVRVRFRLSQDIRKYTSVRVNWTQKTLVFVNAPEPIDRDQTGSMVGIDVGITHTLSNSNSEFSDIPRPSAQEVAQHKKLQRKLARQDRVNEARGGREAKFNSNRRKKTLGQINRIASKQARRRNDWVEKVTTQLVRDHDLIALEDLKPSKMSRSGGRCKRGLNRGILESCWGMFQTRLSFKAELAEIQISWINPAYTSQTCNKCGHISRENRESQAVFKCIECGHIANADINAANNILDRGLESVFGAGHALGRGADVRPDLSLDESGNGDESSTSELVSSGSGILRL